MATTKLRELYHVLGWCSTDTQQAICTDLLRARKRDLRGIKVARLFQDALKQMQAFDAREVPFVPKSRKNTKGTNPVTTVMSTQQQIEVKVGHVETYSFQYLNREIPHLRTATADEAEGKAWIDCVGISDKKRPVVFEIKWKADKNVFYGFIQLLTYLSELATKNQMSRSQKAKLFGNWDGNCAQHDLVILLANSKHAGKKQSLADDTVKLAKGFAECLKLDPFKKAARVVGNIACLSCTIDEKKSVFSDSLKTEWFIPR